MSNMEVVPFGLNIKPTFAFNYKPVIMLRDISWTNLSDGGNTPTIDKSYAGLIIYHPGGSKMCSSFKTYKHPKNIDISEGRAFIMDTADMTYLPYEGSN